MVSRRFAVTTAWSLDLRIGNIVIYYENWHKILKTLQWKYYVTVNLETYKWLGCYKSKIPNNNSKSK